MTFKQGPHSYFLHIYSFHFMHTVQCVKCLFYISSPILGVAKFSIRCSFITGRYLQPLPIQAEGYYNSKTRTAQINLKGTIRVLHISRVTALWRCGTRDNRRQETHCATNTRVCKQSSHQHPCSGVTFSQYSCSTSHLHPNSTSSTLKGRKPTYGFISNPICLVVDEQVILLQSFHFSTTTQKLTAQKYSSLSPDVVPLPSLHSNWIDNSSPSHQFTSIPYISIAIKFLIGAPILFTSCCVSVHKNSLQLLHLCPLNQQAFSGNVVEHQSAAADIQPKKRVSKFKQARQVKGER